jgi:hypothetical protein
MASFESRVSTFTYVNKTLKAPLQQNLKKDREYCLGRVNEHMEMLLKKANRDINLQRHVARHYYIRK